MNKESDVLWVITWYEDVLGYEVTAFLASEL